MKSIKQKVYLPVKEGVLAVSYWDEDKHIQDVEEQEGYFFTPEQFNELLSEVIKQALETAADRAEINDYDEHGQYSPHLDEKSITNTFEETFNKFKV